MLKYYNKNIDWIKANKDRCFINSDVINSTITYQVVETKETDYPSLIAFQKAAEKTEEITIHSLFSPLREADQIADNIHVLGDYLVLIGLGLGYVAHSIKKKYNNLKMILIEPDKQVFYIALKFCDLAFLNFDSIFVGYDDAGIKSHNNKQIEYLMENLNHQMPLFTTYTQKSQERINPELYNRIKTCFQNKRSYNVSDQWKYKKFLSEESRILFIDSSYVLSKECLSAIQETGNLVHYIHIDVDSYDYELFIKKLLNDIIIFKPDFALTINHLGFDKEGRLTSLFNEIELPFVSWFVDSPNVILSSYDLNISNYCNIFVWDDDYIPEVKNKGYINCDYLPLATDTNIFYPIESRFLYTTSFVGSSMVNAIHKNMKSWVHRDDLLCVFPDIVNIFITQQTRHVEEAIEAFKQTLFGKNFDYKKNEDCQTKQDEIVKNTNQSKIDNKMQQILLFDSKNQEEDFKAAILWKATQIYRQSGIDKLSNYMPVISGDQNWNNLLPIEYEILSERWYYDNLCAFYNSSMINFNMTSLQMTNAVNQRVFDVSACGKFLLTDYRKQIIDFFETKDNIVWFDNVEEIPDLIRFYLKNENLRKKISMNSYCVVTKEHTYRHRILKMITIMKKRYKE